MSEPGRLLLVGGEGMFSDLAGEHGALTLVDTDLDALERCLRRGDVLVVNDAATLPASLHGQTSQGASIELRLLGAASADGRFRAVLFGEGDFRMRTEHRPAPPALGLGEVLQFAGLSAQIVGHSALSPRLIDIRFELEGAALWQALYRAGRPVQYAHHDRELPLHAVQTAFGVRPWAAEMPSAGWPLRWSLLLALRRRGVTLVALTHAAGLSATGDPAIDAALPLAEPFEIPTRTVHAITDARASGGRVIAVGTTVVRALEGCFRLHGALRPGAGVTELIIDADTRLRVVDGLLTGVHDPTESHFRLLQAFAPDPILLAALERGRALGYRNHEFGDSMLLMTER